MYERSACLVKSFIWAVQKGFFCFFFVGLFAAKKLLCWLSQSPYMKRMGDPIEPWSRKYYAGNIMFRSDFLHCAYFSPQLYGLKQWFIWRSIFTFWSLIAVKSCGSVSVGIEIPKNKLDFLSLSICFLLFFSCYQALLEKG